jgi:hypothetical protein
MHRKPEYEIASRWSVFGTVEHRLLHTCVAGYVIRKSDSVHIFILFMNSEHNRIMNNDGG